MEKGREKRIISVLMTLTIIFTLMGGTLSYLRWQTSNEQKTNIAFTVNANYECAADGGGDIASASLMPASCTNTTYAIQREITVTPTIKTNGINLSMDLWLDINILGSGLSQSEYFKYALTTEENSCTTGIVSQGTFTGLSSENDDKVMLLDGKEYTTSNPQTYYLYIWIDPLEENNYIVDQPFNFSLGGSCTGIEVSNSTYTESILNGTDPELESGMIPVTISDTGAVTVADITQEWYKYEDKEWANAVLVDSTSRSTYINQDGTFNANTTIPEDDILAYYVWIPRYKYTFPKADGNPETISIIFENNQTTKSVPASGTASGTDYYTHPAFTFGTKELNGIWVGKFETTGDATTPTIKPNESSLSGGNSTFEQITNLNRKTNVATIPNANNRKELLVPIVEAPDLIGVGISKLFKVSLKISGGSMNTSTGEVSFAGNNTYGLTYITDSHMMKNSEWGAVAYLSHSQYGINEEIRINNYYNSATLTGCGASSANAGESTSCGIPYGTPSSGNNTYPQSTTGNITGVFDMSGGAWEYVMGNYNGTTNNYFSTLPNSKYYDKYTVTSKDDCTLTECGGHALYETKGWYSANFGLVTPPFLWFLRGGSYNDGVYAGAFHSSTSNGIADVDSGFRAVLVKGA